MRLATLFFWAALPVAAYMAYSLYGLPHVIFSYSFHDNGEQFNPVATRHYTQCFFIGPYGGFTVPADDGRCGWIKFFKPAADQ